MKPARLRAAAALLLAAALAAAAWTWHAQRSPAPPAGETGASPPRDEVGRWISEREARWEKIADAEFVAVPVAGCEFDAFDAGQVNAALGVAANRTFALEFQARKN